MRRFTMMGLAFVMLMGSFMLLAPTQALACSCVERLDPEAELARADAVFVGTIVKSKPQRQQEGMTGPIVNRQANLFEVQSSWKGVEQSQQIVYDTAYLSSCGMNLMEDATYLVYALEIDGELVTSFCSRTVGIEQAEEDLAALGPGYTSFDKVNLSGQMRWITDKDYDKLIVGGGLLLLVAILVLRMVRYRNRS
ncbi:hypothetical protein [Paenibacillus daejeonensis]|uniref:hypothetical protein n=1 Tax=Paenibacillus daejeonensis TaxID=135193 RepID=UPI00037B81C1|nr:hypothetical protein [Paenibacillus daejeonensis]